MFLSALLRARRSFFFDESMNHHSVIIRYDSWSVRSITLDDSVLVLSLTLNCISGEALVVLYGLRLEQPYKEEFDCYREIRTSRILSVLYICKILICIDSRQLNLLPQFTTTAVQLEMQLSIISVIKKSYFLVWSLHCLNIRKRGKNCNHSFSEPKLTSSYLSFLSNK